MASQEPLEARRRRRPVTVLVAALIVGGCTVAHDRSELPGADQPYPNLATVPERPTPTTTREERRALVSELQAELEQARRTDKALRAETEKQ